ncbi:hypothetical protein WICPIJ_005435 [Wickerhamomyces pijperi]|uniref:Uncharacterized protein n=1 Tax=Wickerhamomyces pijperi TaxID=599730 RepID=A0A9P8Q3Y0_WICPI|nr:hypothetical protein WICPIJ_005435 [Wickerhamomyces pijperi]
MPQKEDVTIEPEPDLSRLVPYQQRPHMGGVIGKRCLSVPVGLRSSNETLDSVWMLNHDMMMVEAEWDFGEYRHCNPLKVPCLLR